MISETPLHLCTLGIDLRREENTFGRLALVERNRGKSSKMISVLKNRSFVPFVLFGEKKLASVIHEF